MLGIGAHNLKILLCGSLTPLLSRAIAAFINKTSRSRLHLYGLCIACYGKKINYENVSDYNSSGMFGRFMAG